ncbi:hypothetical protein CPC08DRAFT_714220 [Agrocybe pediades]|nr:hypothetical protein CPC08DRAFT_714220 [Agrocybe pediades]
MDGMVDIEITLIGGRELLSPHASRRNPSYYLSLEVNGNERRTGRGGKASQALIWDQKFAFAANLDSTLHIKVFCIHRSARRDHEIGQADFNILAVERNKDVEIAFHRKADRSEEKVIAGYITLHLQVAFPATFVVEDSKEDMYFNSSSISFDVLNRTEVQQLSSTWKGLVRSLDKVASYAGNIAGVRTRSKRSDVA